MIEIRRLLVFILFIICCGLLNEAAAGDNKGYKCEGTTYSSTGRVYSASTSQTPYSWSDSKGDKYPIYISNSGSCYIIKKSNKTGKDYKQYMKPEVSQDICSKLGKEYKGKKK